MRWYLFEVFPAAACTRRAQAATLRLASRSIPLSARVSGTRHLFGFPQAHSYRDRGSTVTSFALDGFGREGHAMSFGLYSIGYAIVIIGLIYAADLMHVPTHWIVVLAIVLVGAGILSGVKKTRQKDPVA
jgi:hypothetical protein